MGRGTLYNMMARLSFLVSGYVIHIALARLLGPQLYGVVGIILSLITIARVFVMNGTRQAISKYTAEEEKLATSIRHKALQIQIAFSMIVFALVFTLAGPIAGVLRDPTLVPYIRLSAPIIPIMAIFSVYQASFNGLRQFGRQAALMTFYSLTRITAVLAFVLLGWGVTGVILGFLIAPVAGVVASWPLCDRNPSPRAFPARRIIRFAVPMVLSSVGLTLLMYIDVLFVKALVRDNAQVGYYTSAATIAQTPYYVLLAFVDTLLPMTSHSLGRNALVLARKYVNESLRYVTMLLIPGALVVSVTAGRLIPLLYSTAYIKAAAPLSILIWGLTFYALFVILTTIITAEGKPDLAMGLSLVLIPLDVALNFFLIPTLGLQGAALSTTLTMLVGMVMAAVYVFRDLGTLMAPGSFLKIVVASAAVYLATIAYRVSGLWLLPYYAALAGVYVLALWALGEIKREDVQMAMRLIPLPWPGEAVEP